MWKFLVKNQSIEILEREVLADHQIQYVQFRYTFDGDWKRFHKVVQFSQCDETYSIVLGVDGTSCYLPAELHVGAAKMSVFGYDTEADTTVRATTVPVTLNIRASGFDGEDTPIPPTPDPYAQLLQKIQEGGSGMSAYDIAVKNGFDGTEAEWLESLRGKDGTDGRDGVDGKDGADSANGITPELLEKLQSYPDVNTFATNTALFYLQGSLQKQIDDLLAQLSSATTHNHANANVLDAFTAELLSDLSGLQQFEDNTKYEIQCINEALIPLQSARHTHNNQAILDSITAKMLEQLQHPPDTSHFVTDDVLQSAKDELQDAINEQDADVRDLQKNTHQHKNQSVLDAVTAEMLEQLQHPPDTSHFVTDDVLQSVKDELQDAINEQAVSDELVVKLEQLRTKLNCSAINLSSGFRCIQHDKNVGGSGTGQHTLGNAADICCIGQNGKPISSKLVCCAAQDIGFTGIANINDSYTYTHVDVRPGSKWYGNEVHGNGTATSDFYQYFGISKESTATKKEDDAMMKGIDVSVHNGTIDWQKVKDTGLDFAILRAGYGRFANQKDAKFEDNYAGAKAVGLPIGAYWYSYATTPDEAKQEAEVCISILNGKQFEYPIFFDLEEKSALDTGKENCSAMVKAFCDALENAGYYAGFYMSRSPLTTHITEEVQKRYALWVAEWGGTLNYSGSVGLWQFSSRGFVDGITGNVDLDVGYVEYPDIIKTKGLNGFPKPVAEEKAPVLEQAPPASASAPHCDRNGSDWR